MPDVERQQDQHQHHSRQQGHHGTISQSIEHDSSHSPERPSYSPVTPTLSHSDLPNPDDTPETLPQWLDDEPESLPVSLDDNPDAIALRSALSVLQIQRQRALQDMRDLEKLKNAALEDPEQFIKDLVEHKLVPSTQDEIGMVGDDDLTEGTAKDTSKFGKLPSAQQVFRTPPIEWAKYHIVGEPLDRMHEVQQHYPGYTEETHDGGNRPVPQTIAAPYRPFVDKPERAQSTKKS
ncbi:hypothetical protein PV08_07513 [Exophiala spinifera]|uniref:Uncharacterized protein n=1 Tax=Exophiala spinifera TaxID=91928 RepID=A0A0D2BTY1_9EURO|nr:uncharacterized protein PV08_07513 [Exophiala spinifera]KIW14729.1 hypothetical protein PV08_07513 [Exophiala spinifera]